MTRFGVVLCLLVLSGCVSLDVKACLMVPEVIRQALPDYVPPDGCPVDLHFKTTADPATPPALPAP